MALVLTLFADFTCPHSYVTEAALWSRAEAGVIELRFRAHELYPAPTEAPAPAEEPGWREALAPLARELSLALIAPDFRPRTAKAHEASVHAALHGGEIPLRRAIYEAFWKEGRDVGRIDVLAELAAGAGLEAEDLRIALDIDTHAEEVARQGELARRLRVPGTPTLYVGTGPDARVLVGAHSASALDAAIAAG